MIFDSPFSKNSGESLFHLLGIAYQEVGGSDHEQRLEMIQHGRAAGDKQDALAQRKNPGEHAR